MLAIGPLLLAQAPEFPFQITSEHLLLINAVGWTAAYLFVFSRHWIEKLLRDAAIELGIEHRFQALPALLSNVLREIRRKNSSLSLNLVENPLATREELGRTLERVVGLGYKLLEAESAELALFDRDSGMYHSSLVQGKPFRKSAQAMLSGAAEGEPDEISPDVLVQPIAFAGSVLGTIRIGLKKGRLPAQGDREILQLLALQGGFAIINAQYTQELMRMKRSSEESVKAKTGFLANLSHEIRGPLGIMLNAVELVLDGLCGPINDDQLQTLKMIQTNGQHLLELINDVLDYARAESGRVKPNKEDILVDDLLKDLASVVRAQVDAKKQTLNYRANSEAVAISCDRRHIRQMLINMLTNAVKYTPEGGTIEFWAERTRANRIRISVKDSGIGIEAKDRAKVFAAFERIENAYTVQQIGTGLGMPLTKRLCELNGGSIDFSSEAGKGSHFWMLFPAVEASLGRFSDQEQEKPHAIGKGEAILVIERDDGERGMLHRYLTHLGFHVVAASSRHEAQLLLQETPVALAIVDNTCVDRPDENLVVAMREHVKQKKLPVVLLTSRAFVHDVEKYLKAGVDRCMMKPIELRDLGHVCRQLLDGTYSGGVVDEQIVTALPSKGGAGGVLH